MNRREVFLDSFCCLGQIDTCWSQTKCRKLLQQNNVLQRCKKKKGEERKAPVDTRGYNTHSGVYTPPEWEGDGWKRKKRKKTGSWRWCSREMQSFHHSFCYDETPHAKHRTSRPSVFSMSPLSLSPTSLSPTLSPTAVFSSHSTTTSCSSRFRTLLPYHTMASIRCFSSSSSSRFFFPCSTGIRQRNYTLRNPIPVSWSSSISCVSSPYSSSSFSCLPFLSSVSSLNTPRFSSSSSSPSASSSSSLFVHARKKFSFHSSHPSFHDPLTPLLSSPVSLSLSPLSSSLSSSFLSTFSSSIFHSSASSFSTSLSPKPSSSFPEVQRKDSEKEEKSKDVLGGFMQNERKEKDEEKEKEMENRRKMGRIRNVGIFAHIDAGKTSTTEAFLLQSKQISRKGCIDDGTTTMDFMSQERERGITIQSAATCFPWGDAFIQLIDTPGHVDFSAEVQLALCAIDGACLLLDASRGVEAQTRAIWKALGGGGGGEQGKEHPLQEEGRGGGEEREEAPMYVASADDQRQVAKIIFVNKMDREGVDMDFCLSSIRRRLNVWPLQLNAVFRVPSQQFLHKSDATPRDKSSSSSSSSSSFSFASSSSSSDSRVLCSVPPQVIIDLTSLQTSLYPPSSASLHGSSPPSPLVYRPPQAILSKLGVKDLSSSSLPSQLFSSSSSPSSLSHFSSSFSASGDAIQEERKKKVSDLNSLGDTPGVSLWAWWDDPRILADVEARRDQLMEELALLDDQFDKESFSGSREDEKEEEQQEGEHKADTYRDLKKKINAEDIWKATRRTVLKHQAVPVLFGSAVLNRGITQLLDAVNLLLPSPLDRPLLSVAPPSPLAASTYLRGGSSNKQASPPSTTPSSVVKAKSSCSPSSSGSSCLSPCGRYLLPYRSAAPACVAFKVYPDGKGGRIAFVRVLSGQITPRTPLFNSTKAVYESSASVFHLYRVKADVYEAVKMLESGDIGAIRGLRHTTAGDLLHLGCPSLLSSSFLLPVLSAFGDDDHGCSHSEDFFLSSSSSCSYSLLNETTLACNHESSSSSVKEMEDREENRRSKESRETEETEEALTSGALKEQTKKMIGESSSLVHTPPSLETSSTPSHRHYGRHSLSGTHYRRRRERGHFARLLPVCFSSLECANSREEEQVEAALAATSLSDVALRYTRDESGKFTLWGMGELHLQVIQATLREQFGISTEFGPLEVGYREYLLRPMKGSMVSSSSSSSSLKQRHPRHPTSLSSSSSSPNAFSVTISLSPLPLTPPEQRLAAFLNRKPDPACLVLADVANQVASTSAWSGLMSRSLSSTKRKIHESPSKSPHSSSAVGRDSGFLSSSLQHSTDVFFSLSFTALGQLQALDEGDKHHGDRGMLSHRGSNQKSLRRKHNEDESRSAINIHHSHRHHRVHSDEMTLLGRHGLAVFEAIQQALHHALCAGPLLSYPLDLVHVCLESISHDGSLLPSTAAGACAQLLRLLLRTGKGQQIQREKRATSSSSQKGSKDHSRQLGKKKKISFTNDLTDEETTNDSEDSEIDEGEEEEEDVRERAGLLEPIMHLEIYSPAKCLGPLMRDLSQNRRASVVSITAAAGGREEEEEEEGSSFSSDVMTVNGLGSERRGRGERDMVEDKMMELHATVPLRCMGDYSSILRALSHGQAHFQLRPVGYGRVCPTDEEDLLNKQLFGSSSSYQSQHHEETESFSYMSSRKKSYSSSSSLTL